MNVTGSMAIATATPGTNQAMPYPIIINTTPNIDLNLENLGIVLGILLDFNCCTISLFLIWKSINMLIISNKPKNTKAVSPMALRDILKGRAILKNASITIKNNFENTTPINIPVPIDSKDIIVFSMSTYFFNLPSSHSI